MNLLKKIIILVNLIMCMFCINVFASVTVQYDWNGSTYQATFNLSDSSWEGNYVVVKSSNQVRFFFTGENEMYYSNNYLYFPSGVYTGQYIVTSSSMPISDTYNVTSSINYRINGYTVFASNYDVMNKDTGEVYFKSTEGPDLPDDSTIDWESAFEYEIIPAYTDNTGIGIEHSGKSYDTYIELYTKANNLDGLLNNEELHNNNVWYWLRYDVEFIFTDLDGNDHTRTLHNIQPFDNNYYCFEYPYLVSEMGNEEQYNLVYAAFESYIAFWDAIPWPRTSRF